MATGFTQTVLQAHLLEFSTEPNAAESHGEILYRIARKIKRSKKHRHRPTSLETNLAAVKGVKDLQCRPLSCSEAVLLQDQNLMKQCWDLQYPLFELWETQLVSRSQVSGLIPGLSQRSILQAQLEPWPWQPAKVNSVMIYYSIYHDLPWLTRRMYACQIAGVLCNPLRLLGAYQPFLIPIWTGTRMKKSTECPKAAMLAADVLANGLFGAPTGARLCSSCRRQHLGRNARYKTPKSGKHLKDWNGWIGKKLNCPFVHCYLLLPCISVSANRTNCHLWTSVSFSEVSTDFIFFSNRPVHNLPPLHLTGHGSLCSWLNHGGLDFAGQFVLLHYVDFGSSSKSFPRTQPAPIPILPFI